MNPDSLAPIEKGGGHLSETFLIGSTCEGEEGGLLLVCSGERPRKLLNMPRCTGQHPPKNYGAPKGAEFDKLCYK